MMFTSNPVFSRDDVEYLSRYCGKTPAEIRRIQRVMRNASFTIDGEKVSIARIRSSLTQEQALNCMVNCAENGTASATTKSGKTVIFKA